MTDLDQVKEEALSIIESHKVQYDAHANSVSAVTVFQTNRAEVKRKIHVELEEGQNEVEVVNLPTCLEESSIRVDGIGNATIFDVIYHPPPPVGKDKQDDTIKDLEARKQSVQSELAIVERQTQILSEYSKTLNGKDTTSAQLEVFLDTFALRQARYDVQRAKLETDISALEKEIQEKSIAINADAKSLLDRGVSVTVVVLANGAGPAELSLTYLASNAWWTPQYDLRSHIGKDESENNVSIHYRAAIGQRTGEDWTSVALTLSTASPLQGTEIPSLEALWIAEKPRYPYRSDKRARHQSLRRKTSSFVHSPPPPAPVAALKESAMFGGSMDIICAEVDPPSVFHDSSTPDFFNVRGATASEGATSTTFSIPGLSTIPSDSDRTQQTHKVSISELDFSSVELEWISVPKDTSSAFLRCKVKNTTDYLLLPGDANVFLNGNFVAKSQIPLVSPQESFSCSLGVDAAIGITYHPQSRKTKSSGGSVLSSLSSSKTRSTTFEQSITVKNTRLSRVHRLLLKEQIPVSDDSRIKVHLLEPQSLVARTKSNTIKHPAATGGVQISDGVKVQWVSKRDENDGEVGKVHFDDSSAESARGLLEWVVELEQGASVDLRLCWEVVSPLDVEWHTR